MKTIVYFIQIFLLLVLPSVLIDQNIFAQTGGGEATADSIAIAEQQYYKAAEIAFEVENTTRYIQDKISQIESFQNTAEMDSSFVFLNEVITMDFEEFESFNKRNLSKFFLINTKRVWSSYQSQLSGWQSNISNRISELMLISERIKEKERLWVVTSKQPDIDYLPREVVNRITNSIKELHTLEEKLYKAVAKLSLFDSKIADQMINVEYYISIVDELHENYRENLLKKTQPFIWKNKIADSYEGTIRQQAAKVWHENSKSFKNSLPTIKDNLRQFILWSIFLIILIYGLRYLYYRQNPGKEKSEDFNINELVLDIPKLSAIYMILFVFSNLVNNIPLALSGLVTLFNLIIAFLLLRHYIHKKGLRIILSFTILLATNIFEIVMWYFGNYAGLYLLFEAGLGIYLVFHFVKPSFYREMTKFRYRFVVNILRYPVLALYIIAFVVIIFGYQNLTVLLLKIATQVSVSVVVLIGVWEISKSFLYLALKIGENANHRGRNKYIPLIRRRANFFLSLALGLIWLDYFLVIVELDTPFNRALDLFLHNERSIGSFVFTYNAIYQFFLIMVIAWGLSSVIKIILDEENYKRSNRMRGVRAAVSTTLRMIIGLSGFFLALSGAGIDLTKISILFGAFGVGIGFGLQNIVNNFISGLILIYERPIQVGDTIEVNTLLGVVKQIGIRSSNVRTFDGAEVVVPNSLLVSDQLINWTLSDDKRRIEIVIGVKYGTDPKKVIKILKDVANNHELVSKDPAPLVLFNEFADSSLNFRLLVWVLFENGIRTKSDLAVAIDEAFKENEIEIPFPQLDLHVIDTPIEKDTFSSPIADKRDSKPLIADDKNNPVEEDESE